MSHIAQLIEQSKLNTKYLQPYNKIAEHIVSHSIGADYWMQIYKEFNSRPHQRMVTWLYTRYYDGDRIYTVKQNSNTINKKLSIHFRNASIVKPHGLPIEFVGENCFTLTEGSFSVKYKYSHERQSIVHVIENHVKTYRLEMEMLIDGINEYNEIMNTILILPIEEQIRHERVFSLSFRLYISQYTTQDDIDNYLEDLRPSEL